MKRTIEEINQRIAKGEALVLTAKEVEDLLVEGREDEVREVDVVTTGTMGLMSGTYALLSFQITEPGIHRRFVKATINGVPASVGPCPNESLGIIDVMSSVLQNARTDQTMAEVFSSEIWSRVERYKFVLSRMKDVR